MTFNDVVSHFGGLTKASRAIRIKPSSVFIWQTRRVPDYRQFQIEKLTKGALKADKAVRRKWEAVI